jgi:cytochrome c oxidase cbb3-type subunit III
VSRKKDELLSHDYDGIREFDNALPRWWLYGFYFTIAFSLVYAVNYHVLTTPLWGKPGMVAEYDAEIEAATRLAADRPAASGSSAALVALTDEASLAKGQEIYEGANLCHACHRRDLGGMVGPNLTDNLWIHGCTPAELVKNIATGFPSQGMLPYGSGTRLSDEQLLQLVSYILSKQGTTPANPRAVDANRETACS